MKLANKLYKGIRNLILTTFYCLLILILLSGTIIFLSGLSLEGSWSYNQQVAKKTIWEKVKQGAEFIKTAKGIVY